MFNINKASTANEQAVTQGSSSKEVPWSGGRWKLYRLNRRGVSTIRYVV
jgi:hypothetical protein